MKAGYGRSSEAVGISSLPCAPYGVMLAMISSSVYQVLKFETYDVPHVAERGGKRGAHLALLCTLSVSLTGCVVPNVGL